MTVTPLPRPGDRPNWGDQLNQSIREQVTEAITAAESAAIDVLANQPAVTDAAATRAVSVAADPAIAGALTTVGGGARAAAANAAGRITATPTGGADDTAHLQAILDAVAPALGVTTVHITAGTYWIDAVNYTKTGKNRYEYAGLQPKAGTTLILDPDAVLKVIPNNSPGYAAITIGRDEDNVTIIGGRIEGDRAEHDYTGHGGGTHEWGFGVSVLGAHNVTIDGMTVTGCTGDAVHIGPHGIKIMSDYRQAEHIDVRNCTLDGSRRNNLSVIGGDFILLENNHITRAGYDDGIKDGIAPRYGIDLEQYGEGDTDYEDVHRVTVRGNKLMGNVNAACVNFNGYGVVIEGNYADGLIGYGHGTETIVKGNIVIKGASNSNTNGISGLSGANYDSRSTVTDNVIIGFTVGISLRGRKVTCNNNVIIGFAEVGIGLYQATDATVQGNTLRDGTGTGATDAAISVGASSLGNVIRGNTITNTHRAFAVTSGCQADIRDNTVTAVNRGAHISGGAEAHIRGNTFNMPGHATGQTHALTWDAAAVVLCEDNTILNPSGNAIQVTNGTGGRSRIIGNRILDGLGITYIRCEGGVHEVADNVITSARTSGPSYAITVANSAGTVVAGNKAYPSPGAVKFDRLVSASGTTANTRVLGNLAVGPTSAIYGDTGTPVDAGNTLVPMWA